jgi:RHS repeat-associated protein
MLKTVAMIPMNASAQTGMTYSPGEIYYYTLDHIGRPFALRDDDQDLRWYENHYPFGEIINEAAVGDPMSAGTDPYDTTWTPSFQFPGQYGDSDQFPFVQNHFREYMPEYGRYSTIDPLIWSKDFYGYGKQNPLSNSDLLGLLVVTCTKTWQNWWHEFICIGPNCWGFYPQAKHIYEAYSAPGIILPDNESFKPPSDCTPQHKPECCSQSEWESCLNKRVQYYQLNTPHYNIATYNCYGWVSDLLNDCKKCGKN